MMMMMTMTTTTSNRESTGLGQACLPRAKRVKLKTTSRLGVGDRALFLVFRARAGQFAIQVNF